MLMIVGIHFYTHGLFKDISSWQDSSFNSLISNGGIRCLNRILSEYFFLLFCTSVNCFVIISGYFMVRSQLRIKRVIGIWIQTFFYSTIIPLLFFLFQGGNGLDWLIKGFTPLCSNIYWFVTMYIGLMLLSPFLIKSIEGLNKRQFKLLLIVMGIINIVVIWKIPLGSIYSSGTCLLFFIFLFLVGGYIRTHNISLGKEKYGQYFIVFSLIALVITLVQDIAIGIKHNKGLYHILNPYNGLPFFMSVLLFMYFKNKHAFKKGILQKMAITLSPYILGVYLISDHPMVRKWLWGLFDWPNLMNSYVLIPTLCISIVSIFLLCVMLDFFRSKLFFILGIDKVSSFLSSKITKIIENVK